MPLRINTNVTAINAARNLNKSTNELGKALRQLSTGLRITGAKDDAAGLSVAENFNSQVRGTAMASRNAQDGINVLQTMDGALGETQAILQRMRELAVQSANGALGSDTTLNPAREAINSEFTQLLSQVNSIAKDTQYNGISLMGATTANALTLQVGYKNAQILSVNSVDATSALLAATTTLSTLAGAASAITALDGALGSVSSFRGTFGAQINRLEFTINTLAIQEENAAASESAIRDADIAKVASAFTRSQILVTAGTSILAQSNVLPQTALQLIG